MEGCHENYDMLRSYPESEFCGGKVNIISGRLMHLVRGSIYNFQGHSFFAFGGGQTAEIDIRREYKRWYEAELPDHDEIKEAVLTIKAHNTSVEYIVTHEPPYSVKESMNFEVRQISHMHTFFDAVKNDVEFKTWFFGKMHMNRLLPPKFQCLFDDIITIPSAEPSQKK